MIDGSETIEFRHSRSLLALSVIAAAFFTAMMAYALHIDLKPIRGTIALFYLGLPVFGTLSLVGLVTLVCTPQPLIVLSAEGLHLRAFSSAAIPWTSIRTINSIKHLSTQRFRPATLIVLSTDQTKIDALPKRGLVKLGRLFGIQQRGGELQLPTSILKTGHDEVFAAFSRFHSEFGSTGSVQ